MRSTWNEEYYDIIDFYYWEPQHLGKQKSPVSSYRSVEDVIAHVRGMEVSLNHQMNIFFRLIPNAFLHKMLWLFWGQESEDEFLFHGNQQWRTYATERDPTQPDIFLAGSQSNIAIELKVKAKSNVDQVVKYLLLHYLNERFSSKRKQFFFLYLSPNEFSKLWNPSLSNREELDELVKHYDFEKIEKKTKYLANIDWDDVLAVWQRTHFSARTYTEFYEFLDSYRTEMDLSCTSEETLLKLIDGMMRELKLRDLVDA